MLWNQAQESWFLEVNHAARATPWLHAPLRLYAEYGVLLFAGLLLVSWWSARRDGDLGRVAASLWAPIGVLLAVWVNQLIASAVAEPRPFAVLPHVLVLVSRSTDYSFPSDHAVMAGAVTVGILLVDRALGILTLALAVAMACTRVYVGAHFPLDVIAGLLIGAAIAWASYVLVGRPVRHLVVLLARTRVRPLLTSAPAGAVR